MSAKSVLILAVNALLVQTITAACWGSALNSPWPAGGAGEGLGWAGPGPAEAPPIEAAPCAAGAPFGAGWAGYGSARVAAPRGFAVSSASPIPPIGVSIASDNAIEGILAVGGELPFLGAVELEALPTAGAGSVAYGCGNGAVGIVTADVAPIATGISGIGLGYGSNWAGGLGWAGRGMAPFGGLSVAVGLPTDVIVVEP